ncbi:acyl carrier protein [Streptomyces canus]|uniref:Act minimal PKS acyl carrier protein n=1 Tax=Streptomyces canus TaxID=58343 RepID=A0AAW8FJD8_9ACTN|nr:acyl carrier protein [Streptomyces canus]MDQ0762625.1 act minimal PKS acyl carrier protein [Streptomyces canus]MDQ0908903.1 act minimal PKS acyl carrier protein [Streptomyces canus]MDQ1068931.1 act minimal PKS acyl carrier protein [Streptomyces canus]
MSTITLDDLREAMERCGVEDQVTLDETTINAELEDRGYDSLARLEIFAQLGRTTGVRIPDEAIHDLRTPQEIINYLYGRLPKAS